MNNPNTVSKVAAGVAGSAAVGNAIFNSGEKRQETLQSIFILYLLFGGIYGTYLYFTNWSLRSSQYGSGPLLRKHILLPILTTFGGAIFYIAAVWGMVLLRIEMGWAKSFWLMAFMFGAPLIVWAVFASWAFDVLHRINEENNFPQLLDSKFSAFWLNCGFTLMVGCAIVMFI